MGQGVSPRPVLPQLAGIPAVANAGIKVLDNGRIRDLLLRTMYKKAQGPRHRTDGSSS